MIVSKRAVLFVFAVMCALSAGAAYAADTIGVIDSQAIISKHPSFDGAMSQLQQISRQKENEAKTAADSETDSSKKAQIVQVKRMELVKEEQRLMEPIFKACQEAVRVVAKKRNITLVLEKASVYFGGQDITDDVIKQLQIAAGGGSSTGSSGSKK
ncbi:MAG: OmpH family outer membrane protein [Synergistaceae bacterium]|jgi:outer membrane protein|nr:OmpH family outer membrane protein [Synergistaceae bacterium]